jgi:hypothetical protein
MGKKRASERLIRLVRAPDAAGAGVFCVSSRSGQAFYAFQEIPCAIGGRGFAVHRLGLGDLYHVRVGKVADCSCECLGFLAHGNCKHIQGIKVLIEAGAI